MYNQGSFLPQSGGSSECLWRSRLHFHLDAVQQMDKNFSKSFSIIGFDEKIFIFLLRNAAELSVINSVSELLAFDIIC